MRFFFVSLFVVLASKSVYPQKASIKGRVVDSMTQEPIPYANVILTNENDSSIFIGVLSDDYGSYALDNITPGEYNIDISFIGYKSITIADRLIHSGKNDIEEQYLQQNDYNIDEVKVTATQRAYSYKVDRKVINASSFPSAHVGIDLLANIPSVQTDIEGNITYRGDGKFVVFINGYPTPNGIEKLRQLPTRKIDKVEIITNPSAKYDAEGTGGIINVILKKNRLEGCLLTSGIKASTIGTYGGDFSVEKNNSRGGWYFQGNFMNSVDSEYTFKELQQTNAGNTLYEVLSHTENIKSQFKNYIEFGLNYDIKKKSYVDFSLYINPFRSNNRNTSEGEVEELELSDDILISTDKYKLNSNHKLDYRYLGATLTYEYSFQEDDDHQLATYFDISTYLHPLNEKQIDETQYDNYTERLGFIGKEFNEFFLEADVSYKNKFSEVSSLEFGVNVNINQIPKLTSVSGNFDEDENITPFPKEPVDQQVDFNQNIYSSYFVFKTGVSKWELQIGIRSELTDRKSNYTYDTNQEIVNIPAENRIIDFFPSCHSVYNFSDNSQLALNYSRRIDRPDYWYLIPLTQYQTPYSYYTGNGNLLPSYSNSLEIGYKYSWGKNFFGAELFTRNTTNVTQLYTQKDSANILVITPENIGESYSLGCEFMAGFDIVKWWNLNLSASLFNYILNVDIYNRSMTEKQLNSDSRISNTFYLPHELSLNFNLHYKSPMIQAQGRRDGYFYSDIALNKSFCEDKWLVGLSLSDLFSTKEYSQITNETNMIIQGDYKLQPFFLFKLSYTLDNQQ